MTLESIEFPRCHSTQSDVLDLMIPKWIRFFLCICCIIHTTCKYVWSWKVISWKLLKMNYDLNLWLCNPRINRDVPLSIMHVCMKYERHQKDITYGNGDTINSRKPWPQTLRKVTVTYLWYATHHLPNSCHPRPYSLENKSRTRCHVDLELCPWCKSQRPTFGTRLTVFPRFTHSQKLVMWGLTE